MRSVVRCGLIGILVAVILAGNSGCYGTTVLSGGISKWHGGMSNDNKWVKEAVFIPLFFFVLPFTSLLDYFIFNAIEFWTGDNPLASADASPRTIEDGDYRLVLSPAETERGPQLAVRVFAKESGDLVGAFNLERGPDGTVIKTDTDGRRLASARLLSDGRLLVEDAGSGARVYSQGEVAQLFALK